MVRKYAYDLPPLAEGGGGGDEPGCTRLVADNADLHDGLSACKDLISRYHHDKRWDSYKRRTNEYELVFTSPPAAACAHQPAVASYSPISRSFFKLWEMLCDFGGDVIAPNSEAIAVRAAFLAEGPGGFMESFARWRCGGGRRRLLLPHQDPPIVKDELHGITLISQRNKAVPGWKVHAATAGGAATVHLHRGVDGTGDLYRMENLDAFVRAVGRRSCTLVTADGGFDFSCDFNNQEEASSRLVVCEVYAALRLQLLGGALVLKLYDVRTMGMLRLLHALRACYGRVRLLKPLTSRPANSEKYLLCTGFTGPMPGLLPALRRACGGGGSSGQIDAALRAVAPLDAGVMRGVLAFNTAHVCRQMCCIMHTLALIQRTAGDADDARTQLLRQLGKSVRWCHKYGIPASVPALQHYRRLLAGPESGAGSRSTTGAT
jgi:hypothetical protein